MKPKHVLVRLIDALDVLRGRKVAICKGEYEALGYIDWFKKLGTSSEAAADHMGCFCPHCNPLVFSVTSTHEIISHSEPLPYGLHYGSEKTEHQPQCTCFECKPVFVGSASYDPISEPGKLLGFTWSGKVSLEAYWQDGANTGDEPKPADLCACGCELHTPICECPQCRGKEQG